MGLELIIIKLRTVRLEGYGSYTVLGKNLIGLLTAYDSSSRSPTPQISKDTMGSPKHDQSLRIL